MAIDPSFIILIIVGGIGYFLFKKYSKPSGHQRPDMVKEISNSFIKDNKFNRKIHKYVRILPNNVIGKIVNQTMLNEVDDASNDATHEIVFKQHYLGIKNKHGNPPRFGLFWFGKVGMKCFDSDRQKYQYRKEITNDKGEKYLSDPIEVESEFFDLPPMTTIKRVGNIAYVLSHNPEKTKKMIASINSLVHKEISTEKDNDYSESIMTMIPVNVATADSIRHKREELEMEEARRKGLLAKA